MSFLTGLQCIKCGATYPPHKLFKGCPNHPKEKPVTLTPIYDYARIKSSFDPRKLASRPKTMWRYWEFLPASLDNAVSLEEGMTPLLQCKALGERIGLPHLYIKDESRNPTWSYNDRLASVGISMARQFGATTITLASSGDAGASSAAYAAKAGLDCVIFTMHKFPQTMKVQMQVYGANVLAARTMEDRWHMVEMCVDSLDWFPIGTFLHPPIGYNPYAVEGWKTIGYEICEQMQWTVPNVVAFAVGHGDAYWGTWKAFTELAKLEIIDKLPRMIAAETFGPLKKALSQDLDYVEQVPTKPTVAVSVGTNHSTYAALKTVMDSRGLAETASDEETMTMQMELANLEGIYTDPSSAQTLAVLKKAREAGQIHESDRVVAVLDAAGIKHPEVSMEFLPDIPLVEANLEDIQRTLAEHYRHKIGRI